MASEAIRAMDHYRDTRERISALPDGGDRSWTAAVPACPGWSVRDVVAHLVAVAQDWASRRLTAAPSDAETAAQIARFVDVDGAALLDAWVDATAQLERMAQADGLVPPVGDIVSHEHDIRGALDLPGARDSAAAHYASDRLLSMLQTPTPLVVVVEDAEYRCGPTRGAETVLMTTRFEALRWRTGRRSRAQLSAMNWSADPAPLLEHLYLFGPARTDIVE